MTQPLHIGAVVQNARAFNIQHWRGAPLRIDDLLQAVAELFALLEQRNVATVLVGGIAMLQYVPGRNTEDIDLIVALSSLRKLPEIVIQSQDADFARGTYRGLQIDFLLTKNPLFAHVQQTYSQRQRFLERELDIVTVDGLILLKLYALPSLYRQGNFARVGLYENDIATLLFYHKPDLIGLTNELSQHLTSQDLAAIHDILADIQKRITRFQQNAPNGEGG